LANLVSGTDGVESVFDMIYILVFDIVV